MLRSRSVMLLGAVGLSSVVLAGCPNDYTCYDYRTCAPEGGTSDSATKPDARGDTGPRHDGGEDAKTDGKSSVDGGMDGTTGGDASDAHGDTSMCNGTQAPSAAACVISETYGVFVAPAANGGSDATGAGTRAAPYATITKALSSLGRLTRVYVCNGAYTDQVTVTGAVSIYGGLTCGELGPSDSGTTGPWVYASGTTATVTGSAPAFALEVNAGSSMVDVEDMEFDAAPGTMASPSSIAAFATGSLHVSLQRVTLTAEMGAAGVAGTAGAMGALVSTSVGGVTVPTPSLNGQSASGTTGGAATICTCAVGGSSTGGAGGSNVTGGDADGTAGTPSQSPSTPASATGSGSTSVECMASGTPGSFGSNAVPALAADGPGATIGTLDAAGWHPGSGQSGVNGNPGQGGGGGGIAPGGAGGGGGCGGCGGAGGGLGMGGGASIALLAFDSPVQLFSATLTAAQAGGGGAGAAGGVGIAGGLAGVESGGGCNGGKGGAGAAGGPGGGGSGGVSIGILYQGAAPVPDVATQTTPGSAGAPGTGGDPGVNGGASGSSVAVQNASTL